MIEQIRYMIDIRRAALAQGKSVLQPLDRRGNINHAAEPLLFNSREDALAHQKANRHTNSYKITQIISQLHDILSTSTGENYERRKKLPPRFGSRRDR
jgi:hypothetical protein